VFCAVLLTFRYPGFDTDLREAFLDLRHCSCLNGFATSTTTRRSGIEPSCSKRLKLELPRRCIRGHLRGDGSIPTFLILWEKVRTPLHIRSIENLYNNHYSTTINQLSVAVSILILISTGDATIIIYGYTPSIVVGILGIVLFALAGALHVWQLLKHRSWFFSTMIVGIAFVWHSPSQSLAYHLYHT
jgi:hypothetical protein